jgi:hypothetical protein
MREAIAANAENRPGNFAELPRISHRASGG